MYSITMLRRDVCRAAILLSGLVPATVLPTLAHASPNTAVQNQVSDAFDLAGGVALSDDDCIETSTVASSRDSSALPLLARLDTALSGAPADSDSDAGGASEAPAPAAAPMPAPSALSPAMPTPVVRGVTAASPSALASMPAMAPVAMTWEISMSDKTLSAALSRWATAAGWQLLWELPVDYAVQARTVVPGTFEDAVSQVVRSMEGAENPMKATFYKGNKVLRITARGAK